MVPIITFIQIDKQIHQYVLNILVYFGGHIGFGGHFEINDIIKYYLQYASLMDGIHMG